MNDFLVGDHNYRIAKMDAFMQLHMTRRLAPIMSTLSATLSSGIEGKKANEIMSALQPVAESFAKMPEDDFNYIMYNCMNMVSRDQGEGKFAPIKPKNVNKLMFEDIEMMDIIQLIYCVLQVNLGNFLQELQGIISKPNSLQE